MKTFYERYRLCLTKKPAAAYADKLRGALRRTKRGSVLRQSIILLPCFLLALSR